MVVSLVTGANKGLGFATAQQLHQLGHTVYLGARDVERGRSAADRIGARFVQLDVTDDDSVARAVGEIERRERQLDVLVNNAGIQEIGMDGPTALKAFDTNAVGVVRVTEAALPLLTASPHASVVTVSSSAGSFWAVTNPERLEFGLTNALYAASKAAATMLTVQYAKAYPAIRFNAVEPGYTDTDMTAAFPGGRSVQESARVIVRFATLEAGGPTGALHDEEGRLSW